MGHDSTQPATWGSPSLSYCHCQLRSGLSSCRLYHASLPSFCSSCGTCCGTHPCVPCVSKVLAPKVHFARAPKSRFRPLYQLIKPLSLQGFHCHLPCLHLTPGCRVVAQNVPPCHGGPHPAGSPWLALPVSPTAGQHSYCIALSNHHMSG